MRSITVEEVPLSEVTPRILHELANNPTIEGELDGSKGVFRLRTQNKRIFPKFHLLTARPS